MLDTENATKSWEKHGKIHILNNRSYSLVGKESSCNAGDTGDAGSKRGLGRSPGGGNVNPLQYSCPENPMDRGVWQAVQCMGPQRVGHD